MNKTDYKLYIICIRKILVWTLVLFLTWSGLAEEITKGTVVGKVTDKQSGESLLGVNIMVKGTLLGASSNINGEFQIDNFPPGVYDIVATMMGYKKQIAKKQQIISGQTTTMDFQLESTILEQPTLIVTASKRKQHIEDAPTSVDVISQHQILARGVKSIDEVLQNTTAGLTMIDGQINLRGSNGFSKSAGSRVLLMVDGHPMINGDTGGINWDVIPVDEVERLEVVKGAGSALYGSNAMAGMVNIITRDPTPYPETRLKLTYGFYDSPAYPEWQWWDKKYKPFNLFGLKDLNLNRAQTFNGIDLSHSRQIGKIGILVNLGQKRSAGYFQNGDFSRWNAMGKIKVRFKPQKTLTVTGNWALNDHGHFLQWVSNDRPLEVSSEEENDWLRYEKQNISATFKQGVNQKFAYTLKGNLYRCHWENFVHDNNDNAITDRLSTEGQAEYLTGNHSITFGNEITMYHTKSSTFGNHMIWDLAFYAEDEIKFSPLWTFNFGTRYDYHKIIDISYDQQISPRMGLVWRPQEGTALRLSAGHGFRAPSIAEVFPDISVSGFHVVPNLDLKKAERAWSLELGLKQMIIFNTYQNTASLSILKNPARWFCEYINPQFSLDISFFASWYNNMIDAIFDFDSMEAKFVNMGKARISGFETKLMGSILNGHILTNIGYTFLDPINLDTGNLLPYRSKHQVMTSVELKIWLISIGFDYRYTSKIEEIVYILGSGFTEQVPIHVIDGRINFNFGSFQIGLEGKNLRNYHYTMRQKLLEPIRHFVLTIRGKF
jgi:iron complex outermembrane receptor protein